MAVVPAIGTAIHISRNWFSHPLPNDKIFAVIFCRIHGLVFFCSNSNDPSSTAKQIKKEIKSPSQNIEPETPNTKTLNPKTAIVILNWNGRKFLEQFLPSVIQHSPTWAEVIVADNASTDDSVSWLKSNYPLVQIIQNEINGGFAKGYNDSLAKVNADYFVLLNSDVEVTANWIEPIIRLMESDSTIAACQPKIRAFHDREKFEYAGAAGGYIDKWGFPFCRGRVFDSFETDQGQYNDTREVFWATGASLFVRANAWKEAKGLDEDFFAHMEEIDLCWRLRNAGWKVMTCGDSIVYHVGGGTLSKQSAQKTYLNFRNNLVLLAKNHAPGWLWIKIYLRMVIDGIAWARFIFTGQWSHAWAILRAHVSFYGSLGKTIRKRRELKKQISHYATDCIYDGSIVWQYFMKGKKKFSELKFNAGTRN
jgi:GT2 family glycosyltransferase